MGWAGDCGEPLGSLPATPSEVAFPSGAAMVVRRELWDQLGGFDASYFLYCEDLDLGLRMWLAGQRVGIVPDARVIHSYEFEKGAEKWFWLERNRWRTVLSVYPASLLALLAPALLGTEVALLAVAARDGWLREKLRAQAAVLTGLPRTLRRRRSVQAARRLPTSTFASLLTASLDSAFLPAANVRWADRAQRVYWALVQRILR
jgi:GT2 family glycosyltransferase